MQNTRVDAFVALGLPFIALTLGAGIFIAYLGVVLRGADDLRPIDSSASSDRLRQEVDARLRQGRQELASAPARPPVLRPPEGAVAAGVRAQPEALADVEESGMLRLLEDGPDFQREAAARALTVPFASTGHPEILGALGRVVLRDDCGVSARATAYCAMRTVAGSGLSWDDEVATRQDFPEGADLDWVVEVMDRAEGTD